MGVGFRMPRGRSAARAAVSVIVALVVGSSAAQAETLLRRGAYLVRGVVACGNCHTTKDANFRPIAGMEMAGGFEIELPFGKAVAPNITPDRETGIGRWTDAQIIAAIREGKRPDGSTIGPPMPIGMYRNMSDRDVRAIVAYLRSVKPVHHVVAKSAFKIPLPPSYGPPVTHVAEVPRKDKVAYGHYLASALGHCIECHTPRLENGMLDMTRVGAGGQELPGPGGVLLSANLTPDPAKGLGKWSDKQIKTAITKGVRPDGGKLAPLMAFAWYAHIRQSDLDAIVAYLRSLKPVP
jgi:mono/diheme cytochrome c family protein